MIISKPQTSTLASFALFLSITIGVSIMNIVSISRAGAWYNYLILALLIPIGAFVAYKIFIRYKVIRAGNNEIEIVYPVLKRKESHPLRTILAWRENAIKTGKNSTYKELEILFENKQRMSIGQKEHTEYTRLVQYFQHKLPKKKTPSA